MNPLTQKLLPLTLVAAACSPTNQPANTVTSADTSPPEPALYSTQTPNHVHEPIVIDPAASTPAEVAALFGTHTIPADAHTCLAERGPTHNSDDLINNISYCGLLGTFLDATTNTAQTAATVACLNNQQTPPIDLPNVLATCTRDQP